MSTAESGNTLIHELLSDPVGFRERGSGYSLLLQFFAGLPLDTLRPLLRHDDLRVQRAAVWVASELGIQACPVLDDVAPLASSDDRTLCYHALEATLLCAKGSQVDCFVSIPRALESRDGVIRVLAMRLLVRAAPGQLEAAVRVLDRIGDNRDSHRRGLLLLAAGESLDPNDVRRLLREQDSVAQAYGAVAAKRMREQVPDLLEFAAALADPEIRRFAQETF